jgi:16S rRNA (uracil1498-N3)-methyltransferase
MEGAAAHHLANVLRAEPGQLYELSDGRELFLARVERVARDRVEFALVEPLPAPAPQPQVTLLLSLVKFDRFEWALEKATELGAEIVIPLAAERSEKRLIEAAVKRADRWNKILLESAQQARCLRPPQLQLAQRPADAFRAQDAGIRILLSERPQAPPLRQLFEAQSAQRQNDNASVPAKIALAVGPEGGWTDAEFAAATAAGFSEASLGDLILRTETAAIAALSAALFYFQSAK